MAPPPLTEEEKLQKKLEKELANIQDRIREANIEVAKAKAEATAQSALYSEAIKEEIANEKLRLQALRKQLELSKAKGEDDQKTRERIQEKIGALKLLEKGLKDVSRREREVQDQVKAGATIYKAQLSSYLSLSSGMNTFAQSLAGGKNGLLGYATAALESVKSGDLLKGVALKLIDVNIQFALEQDKVISNFRQQTGAGTEFNNVIRDTERATFAAGVTLEDTAQAVTALKNQFTDFTYLNQDTQKEVTKTTALLNQMGFDFSTQANIMQTATQAMGMTVDQSQDLLLDLASTARSLGIDINKLGADFEASKDFIVRFGDDGQEVFEELAVQAKALGMELSGLIGVVEKFKTFDSAAQSVGRLNAILGGPFLNSIDMLNAAYEDPIEGIKMLREGFDQAGVSIEDLSGAELEAFASALGMTTTETKKLLGATNEELEIQRIKQDELAEQAAATQAIQEKLNNAMKGFYANLGPIVDGLTPLIDKLGGAAQAMGDFINSGAGIPTFMGLIGALGGAGIGLSLGLSKALQAATAAIPVVGPALAAAQAQMVNAFTGKALAFAGIGALAGGIGGALLGVGVNAAAGVGGFGSGKKGGGVPKEYAGKYANGGIVGGRGTAVALVGERGPEFVEMPTGTRVDTAPKTEALTKSIETLITKLDKMGSGTQQIAVYVGQEKIDELVVKGLNSEKARSAFSPYTNA
jgi:hypothetical protein